MTWRRTFCWDVELAAWGAVDIPLLSALDQWPCTASPSAVTALAVCVSEGAGCIAMGRSTTGSLPFLAPNVAVPVKGTPPGFEPGRHWTRRPKSERVAQCGDGDAKACSIVRVGSPMGCRLRLEQICSNWCPVGPFAAHCLHCPRGPSCSGRACPSFPCFAHCLAISAPQCSSRGDLGYLPL